MAVLNNSNNYTPKGLEQQTGSSLSVSDIDVEIEGMESEDTPPDYEEQENTEHYVNFVEELSEETKRRIGSMVVKNYMTDLESKSEWIEAIVQGLENLGLSIEETDDPFPGACTLQHPIILENAIEFQSKSSAVLLPPDGPVKTKIHGKQTTDKQDRATRVRAYMNYQLTSALEDYYDDTERMLLYLPLIGSCFKKVSNDPELKQPCSDWLPLDEFIINDGVKSFRKAPWYTQVINLTKNELELKYQTGEYVRPVNVSNTLDKNRPTDPGTPSEVTHGNLRIQVDTITGNNTTGSMPNIATVLEQHIDLDLPEPWGDGTGKADPYVVSVLKESNQVIGIKRNWREGDYTRKKIIWFVHYPFIPGLGFHGLGYFHLLSNTQAGLTAISRALIDAGQFANLPAGFKKKGTKVMDEGGLSFGEWRDIEYYGTEDISKVLLPMQYREPSATLFNMLEYLDQRAQRFADTTKQVVADSQNYGPVGTTMALLQHSNRLFSAIHKRLHKAQAKELKMIQAINYWYMDEEAIGFNTGSGDEYTITRNDFNPSDVTVEPVSDPNISSEAQRVSLASTKLDAALKQPNIHDMRTLYRDFYMALGVDNIDQILPSTEEPKPLDPMSDILAVTNSKPIRAFPGQNHEAHIKFKEAWLKDPTQGAAEIMRSYVAPVLANVREHMLLDFKEKLDGTVKSQQPSTMEQAVNDPKILEAIMAEAAMKVSEVNQRIAEEKAGGDPISKLADAALIEAMAEDREVRRKERMDIINATLKDNATKVAAQREANRAKEAKQAFGVKLTDLGLKATDAAIKTKKEDKKKKNKE